MKKLKTVKRYFSAVSDPAEEPEQWTINLYRELDENGNEVVETHFLTDGEIESKTEQIINSQGLVAEKKTYIENGELAEHLKFTYNEAGKLKVMELLYADGSTSVKKYDKQGNEVHVLIEDDEGEYEGKELIRLDAENRILEESSWDEEDRVISRTSYVYDEEGNQIQKTELGEDEEFISNTFYKYDENGNQVEVISLSESNNLISRRISEYNDLNQLVKEEVDDHQIIYEYDENGNRCRDEIIDPSGNILSFNEYRSNSDGLSETILSAQRGNMMYTRGAEESKGKMTVFVKSKYEYEFYE